LLKLYLGVLFQNNLAICCKLWALKSKALLLEMKKNISLLFFSLCLLGRTSAQTFGSFTFNKLPQDFQLYPRESTNLADITVEGVAKYADITAVSIRVLRNGAINKYQKIALTFSGSLAKFSSKFQIPAELAEYDFEVYGFKGKDSSLVVKRKNIVAGDAYLVSGQSNAWIGPIDDLVYQGEWVRSFGLVQGSDNYGPYNLADTLWSLPVGRARIGPWAAEIGRLLFDSEKIPISIINSSAGGSDIDWHLILDGNLTSPDGGNIMLYKATKAGVIKHIKAIIFRQGESEASVSIGTKYLWGAKFETLKQKYKKYFPAAQYLFTPQNNVYEYPYPQAALLREDIRIQQQNDPYVKTFATVGLTGFDRIHYNNFGYRQAALELFRIISKVVYKRNLTNEVFSPSIQRVYYFSPKERNKIFLEFDEGQKLVIPKDTTIIDNNGNPRISKFFNQFFGDKTNSISLGNFISKIEVVNLNKLLLTFKNEFEGFIGYIPDYHRDFISYKSEYPFPGPYIKNSMGMRALGFSYFPVESETAAPIFNFYPNPSRDKIKIDWPTNTRGKLTIYNMSGHIFYEEDILGVRTKLIDVSQFPNANYFVTFTTLSGNYSSKRLVIIK
jgi:hypothetical protein